MVDFKQRFHNTDKFRQAALHFLKYGTYTDAPRGTSDYVKYWDQETERCLNGYTAEDGEYITGYHYFYLNYSPIYTVKVKEYVDRYGVKRQKRERSFGFPSFWDYDAYYYYAIDDAESAGQHMAVLKCRKRGYEQPYSELVATPNGFTTMGSLQVGDEVMNPDGKPTKVVEIFEQGYKDVYQLELADGRTVRCGADHLWEVICANNHFKRKVVTTHDLMTLGLFNHTTVNGKQYNVYKYYLPAIQPVQYSEKQQNIHPYVLGALLGDGALTKRTPKISSMDKPILDRLQELLGDGFEFEYDPTTTCEYRIVDKERFLHKDEFKNGQYGVNRLHRWLEDLNLCVGCEYKYIPDQYKFGSVEQRIELVKGLMDTDGYISKDGSMVFSNTSKQLIDDFVEVIRSLGLLCTVVRKDPASGGVYNGRAIFGTKFSYNVYIKGNPDIFYLPRKRNRIRFDRKFSNKVAIVDIKWLGEQEQQRCIMVDNPNHLYLTRDYIPTHNSFKGASMLVRNYELIPGSKNFAIASEQKFLIGDGLLTKAWAIMDFIDKNTAWAKQRLKSTAMERTSGFKVKDEFGKETEQGYQSSIIGITLKNDPERIRGTRGKLFLWEEAGKFDSLMEAWSIARSSLESDDGVAFGSIQIAFGCVCAGTKVFTNTGDLVNIEDISKEDGILGWDTYQTVRQDIENINPPSKKECVRIITASGRKLECSKDHPLLWSQPNFRTSEYLHGKQIQKKGFGWHEAGKCQVGDQIGVAEWIPFVGKRKMWEPRLVGWLIGDGSYGYDKTPRLSNCDKEILDYVESNFDTVTERSHITKEGKLYKEVRIKGICPKLRELGIYGQTKGNKRLPLNIHQYDKETLSELIGGIVDTDGHVSLRKDGNVRINITQAYPELLKEIQFVLMHFGVNSNLRKINPTYREHISNGRVIKDVNPYYRLEINDLESVYNFAECIELKVGYKQAALDLIYLYAQYHHSKYAKFVSGVRFDKIVSIEDIGEQTIYNLTASGQHNYIANGFITHNTGGTEGSSFDGLKDMFYHPESYNIYAFPNIWDEDADENQKCGFFCPQWSNMEGFDEHGNQKFMDKDGNSLKDLAIAECVRQRKVVQEGKGDQQLLDRFVAERPLTPAEAILELGGNIFPRKLLLNQLSKLRTNTKLQSMKHVVDLRWDGNGGVEAVEKKSGDITTYPLKNGEKPEGSVVIWEYPVTDPPYGLYIAGNDPYDQNESGTNSLGSTIIFKRFKAGEAWTDVIVAEYSGRPNTADEYYENVRKLLTFYNARCLYENEKLGIYQYFVNKHCDYLLADQPDKVIAQIFRDSRVNRKKGCHMTKQVRQYAEEKINEWLREEYEPGHPNLERIYSEPLLEELIMNNGERNVDRVIALCMVMIFREELYQIKVQEHKDENKQVQLFDMPLFGTQWWREPSQDDDVPIFTF